MVAGGGGARPAGGPPGPRPPPGDPPVPGAAAGRAPGIVHADPTVRMEARYIERVRTICGILNIGAAQVRGAPGGHALPLHVPECEGGHACMPA